jgi:hypothetical protein
LIEFFITTNAGLGYGCASGFTEAPRGEPIVTQVFGQGPFAVFLSFVVHRWSIARQQSITRSNPGVVRSVRRLVTALTKSQTPEVQNAI